MKIQDIISLKKKTSTSNKTHNSYSYCYENKTQLRYEKKNGYYWEIPSHSQNQSILLNNYEKDCVIAYIDNAYMKIFLISIRGKDKYKAFIYLKDVMKSIIGSYTITQIYNKKKLIEAFDLDVSNVNIIDNTEYQRFKKLMLFEALEGGN